MFGFKELTAAKARLEAAPNSASILIAADLKTAEMEFCRAGCEIGAALKQVVVLESCNRKIREPTTRHSLRHSAAGTHRPLPLRMLLRSWIRTLRGPTPDLAR
jgi:hypothetical protein